MLTFQGVSVEARGCKVGEQLILGSQAWQEVMPGSIRPPTIELVVSVDIVGQDLIPFTVFGGKEKPLRGYEVLTVPVRWQGKIPMTRQTGVDNTDVHLMTYEGHDLDIQVGVITRQGRFFVTAQQLAKGWIVRGRDGYDFVASDPVHAYPGFSYNRIWPRMGEAVERVAREFGAPRQAWRVKRLAEMQAAVWRPTYIPEPMFMPEPRDGWLRGAPLFFNMISGTGEMVDFRTVLRSADGRYVDHAEIGRRYFVHFSKVPNGGLVPLLEPMKSVYFRTGLQSQGDRTPPVEAIEFPAAA